MKRVFIVYGWDGYPEEGWFPWLKKELEAKDFEVHVPQLPEAANPRIYNWVPALAEAVGQPDDETYFVGHSMGCQTIARYLETLPMGMVVGGAVFVAGFFKRLSGFENDVEVQATDRHWLQAPLDLAKVHKHLRRSVAIFSDDDPFVPLDNQEEFRDHLGSEIIVEHEQGHFNKAAGITQVPVALKAIIRLSEESAPTHA